MTEQDCRTKAELLEEIESLKNQLSEVKKDKSYWYENWSKQYDKNDVYVKRLKAMQHAIALLASMVGEVDITALTTEEKA